MCVVLGKGKKKIYTLPCIVCKNSFLQQRRPFARIPFIVKLSMLAKDFHRGKSIAESSWAFPPASDLCDRAGLKQDGVWASLC